MIIEHEPRFVRYENRPALLLSVLFIVVLLVAICALSVMVLNQLKDPRAIAQPDNSILVIPAALPAALPPAVIPANQFSISMPVILSGSVSLPGEIWKVTKIKSLGYELDSQRYDLATFTRIDGQETVKGYCMNRGWDTPDIGAEYFLNGEGIFVPVIEQAVHPVQRFLRIQQ
jgi:hypothetical protein